MATIKLKRGSGVPSGLAAGEPAMDTDTGRVYISKDGSSVVEVGSTALDSSVSNNLTVGNDATVSGNTTLNTVTVNGLSSLSSVDATSLQTTGSMIAGDLYSNSNALISGSVTAASGSITNNLTVGGTVSATGGNSNNWNAAYSNRPTNLTFSTSNGILTLQKGTGTETVDLDGRFLQVANGLFVPVFSDESGNTASYSTQYGAYSKIFIGTNPLDYQQKWFMISVSGINTSGLVSTDKLVIDLTSVLAIDVPVSAENILVTDHAGFVHSSGQDRAATLHGFPENNNQFNTKIVLRVTDRDSQGFITIGDITSNANNLVMSGWII